MDNIITKIKEIFSDIVSDRKKVIMFGGGAIIVCLILVVVLSLGDNGQMPIFSNNNNLVNRFFINGKPIGMFDKGEWKIYSVEDYALYEGEYSIYNSNRIEKLVGNTNILARPINDEEDNLNYALWDMEEKDVYVNYEDFYKCNIFMSANYNPVREDIAISTSVTEMQKSVIRKILDENKLDKVEVCVTEVFVGDFLGNGKEQTLIIANTERDGDFNPIDIDEHYMEDGYGVYSIAVLVDEKNNVMEVYKKISSKYDIGIYTTYYSIETLGIYDLNQDGIMEIIFETGLFSDKYVEIYTLKDRIFEQVFNMQQVEFIW